jgi:glycosyltransferase involved in cell wall biosynthesis
MSCGVPVLASDRGSLPEVVGDAGVFFDPTDPSSITETIINFLQDPGLRARAALAAFTRAKAFTWHEAAMLAEGCFRRCVQSASRT